MAPAPFVYSGRSAWAFELRRASFGDWRESELHEGTHIRAPVEVVDRRFEGPGRVRADRLGGGGAEPTADEVEIRGNDVLKAMREDTAILEAQCHFGSLLGGEGRGEVVTRMNRHFRRQGQQRRIIEREIARFVDRSTQKRARDRIVEAHLRLEDTREGAGIVATGIGLGGARGADVDRNDI